MDRSTEARELLAKLERKRNRVHPTNRDPALILHVEITFGDLEALIEALSSSIPGGEVVEAVIAAARKMPRATPGPGACSTLHRFEIEASTVWELDRALTNLDASLPPSDPGETL